MKLLNLVAAIALAVLLAGCVPLPDPVVTAAPKPSASSTPSTSPSPSLSSPAPSLAPPSGPPGLGDLVLTTSGFAQLPLGIDPHVLDPSTAIVQLENLECGGESWRPIADAEGGRTPFWVALDNAGAVAAIQVASPSILTTEGIGSGSTRDQVLAAYPGISVAVSNDRYDAYTVDGSDGRLTISVAHNRQYDAWDAESVDTVQEMHVTTLTARIFAPNFHPIGASCL